jgi:hypothetical protein
MEIWKAVVGFEGVYAVSTLGNVKSLPRVYVATDRWANEQAYARAEVLRRAEITRGGYARVHLRAQAHQKKAMVHHLVAEAFIGPRPTNQHQINHKNGIKTDNTVKNLEWVTSQQNHRHRTRVLKLGCGERHYNSKLTADDVRKIRAQYASGALQSDLAKQYGVRANNISFIVRRKTWATVD